MKKLFALALGLVVIAGLAGCGKSGPSEPASQGLSPSPADVAAINSEIAANPAAVEEDVYESNDPTALDPESPGMAAIRPFFWWRKIDSVSRTFTTTYSAPDSLGRPTLATVAVHKRLLGTFNILVADSVAHPDSLLRKRLDDRWERLLLMKRVRVDSLGNPVWRLVGTSGVEITSANAVTRIQSVRVQAGLLDTTITDPLQLHRLRRVLHVPGGTQMTVTVTTGSPTDVVLLYRWGFRARFHNNGDGTFTARWNTSHEGGLRHFGVNAVSNGTLFDDAAPYDSQAWLFAFAVLERDCDLDRND